MLVTAGLNDPRVAYWEPAKWTAKLRARKTDEQPAAAADQHGRGPRRRVGSVRHLREIAFKYAFVLDVLPER